LAIDIDAWYRKYGPMVLRRCRALLKDEEEAMDAMQDVFVEVARRKTMSVDAPSSFLYRTATNVCLNKMRSRKRKPQDLEPELVERIASAPIAEERSLTRDLLARLFSREPESTKLIAVMHLVDGYTLQEVATETGMSVSGVRKRLRKLKAHVPEVAGSVP